LLLRKKDLIALRAALFSPGHHLGPAPTQAHVGRASVGSRAQTASQRPLSVSPATSPALAPPTRCGRRARVSHEPGQAVAAGHWTRTGRARRFHRWSAPRRKETPIVAVEASSACGRW
jgi:hypothetical protein